MKSELPLQIQKAVRRYQPIQVGGAILYPVKVKDFDDFQMAIPALTALQQSFPVKLMSMPILQAMYRLDCEALERGEEMTGLFYSAIIGLALALRLGEGLSPEERVKRFSVFADPNDRMRLRYLEAVLDGGESIQITPVQYGKIRPVIAEQNGVRFYGNDANPELVEAENIMAEQGAKLKGGIEDEIEFVRLFSEHEDIDEWAILKLHNKANAARRVLDYVVYGVNEGAGCTWKGGNPAPHPWLEKERSGGGAVAAESVMGGAAERAIQNEGKQTTL